MAENRALRGEVEELRGENERLRARVAELEGKVEGLRRDAKRQAAPFSRGEPEKRPRRAGRKAGSEYGTKAHRRAPEEVDETLEALLGEQCDCGGEIAFERVAYQYREELPEPRPIRRRIKVFVGRCRCCGRRHQGRHPQQTSDALGAAGSMLGARAVAHATLLNKELGLSPQKTAKALAELGGVSVTPGGVSQAVARQARALQPTYEALIEGVRQSPAVAPDETGWRVGGHKAWLWAFAGDGVTVYRIAPGRGYEHAKDVLGADYSGTLERDGWAPYRRFEQAAHQTCYAHLLRRASELIADSVAGQARIPHAVRQLLLDALALRDRHADLLAADGPQADAIDGEAVEIDPDGRALPAPLTLPASSGDDEAACGDAAKAAANARGELIDGDADGSEIVDADRPADTSDGEAAQSLAAARADLQAQLDKLLARNPTHAPNRKLLKHLANERDHLFTFLDAPGVQATNWRAEQALRPAIVNRKSWGGNRTWTGAHTQEVTISVIRTARQQHSDPIALMVTAQRAPQPQRSQLLALPTRAGPTQPQA